MRDLAEARPALSPPLRALRRSLALLAASGSNGNSSVDGTVRPRVVRDRDPLYHFTWIAQLALVPWARLLV